ncbi:hypothetical protein [Streptomyces sp. SID9124]|uniref:hypothetical protein n=1 Tax=Streptomyces sp. SID9124 TaxID=2706108 RepID=UPI0013DF1784|nr:hypothetical protein [Streptomyces sp. SID9124]NED11853.1 hypothetical protein [Streptomyces sp. SID9124]
MNIDLAAFGVPPALIDKRLPSMGDTSERLECHGASVLFEDLGFKVGDAFVGESKVGPGAFQAFLKGSVFLRQLVDSVLEGRVLGGELLDGLARDHQSHTRKRRKNHP